MHREDLPELSVNLFPLKLTAKGWPAIIAALIIFGLLALGAAIWHPGWPLR